MVQNNVIFKNVKEANPRLSNGKMHQSDRNNLRLEIMNEVKNALSNFEGDFEMGFVSEGLAINVQNDELGNVSFVIDVKMKNLDYDFDFEVSDFAEAKAAKEAKAKANKEAKELKIKADAERRQKIAELKAKGE